MIEAARRLPIADRRKLANAILSDDAQKVSRRITEIRGVGKDVWKDVDAKEYISSERSSWRG